MPIQSPAAAQPVQTLAFAPFTTVYDLPASPKQDVITYSKGVQTAEVWSPPKRHGLDRSDSEDDPSLSPAKARTRKRLSRRERDRDEELRLNVRKEIEEELHALSLSHDAATTNAKDNFPSRTLTHDELNAVTASDDFLDFIERSTKVIERALDEEYDVLADYAVRGADGLGDDDDDDGTTRTRKGRRVREVYQFQDERWTKRRMISDLDFSVKVCALILCGAGWQIVDYPSTPSFYWHRIRKRQTRLKAPPVWLLSGMPTCHHIQNTLLLQPATFSPLAFLPTIQI